MNTADFIVEKVAPIFNKKGYIGTSLSDITEATKLTKGAVYCNFSNKEDLALKAFTYNMKIAISPLFVNIEHAKGSVAKLYAITSYQRAYYDVVKEIGGCPMIRASTNTKFINPLLFNAAQRFLNQFLKGITQIIEDGISNHEIKDTVVAEEYARILLSSIEGSTFLAFTHDDNSFVTHMMDYLGHHIIKAIKK